MIERYSLSTCYKSRDRYLFCDEDQKQIIFGYLLVLANIFCSMSLNFSVYVFHKVLTFKLVQMPKFHK